MNVAVKKLPVVAVGLVVALAGGFVQAAIITEWSFNANDNSLGQANALNPAPTTGSGTAQTLGRSTISPPAPPRTGLPSTRKAFSWIQARSGTRTSASIVNLGVPSVERSGHVIGVVKGGDQADAEVSMAATRAATSSSRLPTISSGGRIQQPSPST